MANLKLKPGVSLEGLRRITKILFILPDLRTNKVRNS
jgi:hypothetical protein